MRIRYSYHVVQVRDVASHELPHDQAGKYDPAQQLIMLGPHRLPIERAQTLVHELLHLVWAHVGLATSGDEGTPTEERIVEALAAGLIEILNRNPALARALLAAVCPRATPCNTRRVRPRPRKIPKGEPSPPRRPHARRQDTGG